MWDKEQNNLGTDGLYGLSIARTKRDTERNALALLFRTKESYLRRCIPGADAFDYEECSLVTYFTKSSHWLTD